MTDTATTDIEESVAQAIRIFDAGADLVRLTAQGEREVRALREIRIRLSEQAYLQPLVADIHFNPKAADAALQVVEKVRINPGNYVDRRQDDHDATDSFERGTQRVEKQFGRFVKEAKELGRSLRIGVNHGSLSERMMLRYGDTPEGMVESAMEYLEICRVHHFEDVLISMKASNVMVMTESVRMLVDRMDAAGMAFPLHLGVTEAGDGEDGRIKSAVGIGSLLADGIGDTIRVSLSEAPEEEIPVARVLRDYIVAREGVEVVPHAGLGEYKRTYLQRNDTYSVNDNIGADALPIVVSDSRQRKVQPVEEVDFAPDYTLTEANRADIFGCAKLVEVFADELSAVEERLRVEPVVLLLSSRHSNPVADWRRAFLWLEGKRIHCPVILHRTYDTPSLDHLQLFAAADFGSLLLEGRANGLSLAAPNVADQSAIDRLLFGILQATRLRMSRPDYISCPGCGRTLYDLKETIARIKAATSHLKGLKIGIMGCIVNGPGEMADADYGYVGSTPGKIDLYKGQVCKERNIPTAEAVDRLISLIREGGDWYDPIHD